MSTTAKRVASRYAVAHGLEQVITDARSLARRISGHDHSLISYARGAWGYQGKSPVTFVDDTMRILADMKTEAVLIEDVSNNNTVLYVEDDGKLLRRHGEISRLIGHIRELASGPAQNAVDWRRAAQFIITVCQDNANTLFHTVREHDTDTALIQIGRIAGLLGMAARALGQDEASRDLLRASEKLDR